MTLNTTIVDAIILVATIFDATMLNTKIFDAIILDSIILDAIFLDAEIFDGKIFDAMIPWRRQVPGWQERHCLLWHQCFPRHLEKLKIEVKVFGHLVMDDDNNINMNQTFKIQMLKHGWFSIS